MGVSAPIVNLKTWQFANIIRWKYLSTGDYIHFVWRTSQDLSDMGELGYGCVTSVASFVDVDCWIEIFLNHVSLYASTPANGKGPNQRAEYGLIDVSSYSGTKDIGVVYNTKHNLGAGNTWTQIDNLQLWAKKTTD